MASYAHIKNNAIWRRLELDPADVPVKKQSYLLPIVEDPRPARERAIHTLDRAETIEATRVHVTWLLADKPLDEVKTMLKARVDIDAGKELLKNIIVLINAAVWTPIAQKIEDERLGAKAGIETAKTVTEAWTVYQAIIWGV